MKLFCVSVFALLFSVSAIAADSKKCICTCVVKDSADTYSTRTGSGPDRESAGENLKAKLGKKTCELSPDCKGAACKAD